MSTHTETTAAKSEIGSIVISPVAASIGAEVQGIDLSTALDDRTFEVIHNALLEHQVLFFRDQSLDVEEHLALAGRFGEPAYSKKLPMYDGRENVSLLDNDGTQTAIGAAWHTDNTDFANPPWGSLLYAESVPSVGGDTMWCSMTAAFAALSTGMQQHLRTLTALHDNARVRQMYASGGGLRAEGAVVEEPVKHPVIRQHPETGRPGIFVNSAYTTRIVGIPEIESRHLLSMLHEHVMRPEFQVRFRWTAGAMAIWDNRSTQHYALDDYTERRRMRRVQIVGDVPTGVATRSNGD